MDITGTIRNASFYNGPDEPLRSPCIKGQVFGDAKSRFHDGESITTSKIEAIYDAEGGVIVKTRFSAYFVVFQSVR
jgi:hypothetical protein